MTKFNPQNKEILTFGECLEPAMKITEQEDADQYFLEYVNYIQKFLDIEPRNDNKSAYDIAKINLGYYYDNKTRERVEELFFCSHPIFGKIKDNGSPTPQQAFKAGVKYAQSNVRKEKIKNINNEN